MQSRVAYRVGGLWDQPFLQVFEKNGGDDGTRTRGLCRDSFTTTYKTRGDFQTQRKSYKTTRMVGWVVGWKIVSLASVGDAAPEIYFTLL